MSATVQPSVSSVWQDSGSVDDGSNTVAQLSGALQLLALMVRTQSATQAGSKTDVEIDYKKLDELKKQLEQAVQNAKDAADHSGFFGFLSSVFGSDVAQIAGAVAAVAAIVATGGAAAPLIVMAISVAMEEGAQVAQKLGLDPRICAAISLAGAALGACSGIGTTQSASTLASVARDVKLGAQITQGAATSTGAVLGGVAADYHSDQLHDQADAVSDQAQSDAANMDFDTAISLLQAALRTEQSETNTASAIIQNNSDASSALSNRI